MSAAPQSALLENAEALQSVVISLLNAIAHLPVIMHTEMMTDALADAEALLKRLEWKA